MEPGTFCITTPASGRSPGSRRFAAAAETAAVDSGQSNLSEPSSVDRWCQALTGPPEQAELFRDIQRALSACPGPPKIRG